MSWDVGHHIGHELGVHCRYTPAQQGSQYNSGASHRIIKMQDMPVDPMEPPKFRAKKVRIFPGIVAPQWGDWGKGTRRVYCSLPALLTLLWLMSCKGKEG